MGNVFERNVDVQALAGKPVASYTAPELVAFITKNYPNAPQEALRTYRDNTEIGFILYEQTSTLLEGLGYAKRN